MAEKEVIEKVRSLVGDATSLLDPAVIAAVRSREPQITLDQAEECLALIQELVTVINQISGNGQTPSVVGLSAPLSAHPQPSSKATEAQAEISMTGDRQESRKHDNVFDFIALEFLRYQDSQRRLASKKDMLAVLQAYDPRATDKSLSPTLHKWQKEPKAWVQWPPRSLDKISLTDRGREHLSSIHDYAMEKKIEVVDAMRSGIDKNYQFPETL